MAAAMEEALQKMRKQERAMQARAEASERLSGEIIASLTSGLLVVSQEGIVRTLNPAGQQLLGLPDSDWMRDYREVLADSAPLATSSRNASSRGCRSSAAPSKWSGRARARRISASPFHPFATTAATNMARSACSPI